MSIEAITWALNHAPIPRDRRDASSLTIVLVGLANHADPEGRNAFPAVSTLAKYGRLSGRSVQYALRTLEELELISPSDPDIVAAYIKRGDRRPKGYDLAMSKHDVPVDNLPHGVQALHPANVDGVQTQPHGVQTTTPRGAELAPDPSVKKIRPKKKDPDPERVRAREAAAPETDADGRTDRVFDKNTNPEEALAAEIVASLSLRCGPSPKQRGQIRAAVADALTRGVPVGVVAEYAHRKASEAQTVKYFLRAFDVEYLPADIAPATPPCVPTVLPACDRCGARAGEPAGARFVTGEDGRLMKCSCRDTVTGGSEMTLASFGDQFGAASGREAKARGWIALGRQQPGGYVNQTDANVAALLAGGSTSRRGGYQGWRNPVDQDLYDEPLY